MSSWLKALLVLALVVPMTSYIAGSIVSSGAREPADRSPVIIGDPSPLTPERPRRTKDERVGEAEDRQDDRETQVAPSRPAPTRAPAVNDDDDDPQDDHSARVVTPSPTRVGPVDDNEEPEGDRDEDDDATDGGADDDEDADDADDRDGEGSSGGGDGEGSSGGGDRPGSDGSDGSDD